MVAVFLIASCFPTLHAAVRRVPGEYSTIQKAIDASLNGDQVLVSPGVYVENIRFRGRAITVSSTNVADPEVVGSTIIHATGPNSAVTFADGERSNSVLAGFTITGGYGTVNSDFGTGIRWGAGIYCHRSSPTIIGNIITGNHAPPETNNVDYYGGGGGGIGCIESEPLITRNLITANSGYYGGGIRTYIGKARIVNNIIASNSATVGGGVALYRGQLINNTLVGNGALLAGNVYAVSDYVGQCFLSDNIICNATNGGGIKLYNVDAAQTTFNDVWNNAGGDYYQMEMEDQTGLNGNISRDPEFVDAASQDFQLRDTSPCINAGDPNLPAIAGAVDFYGNARQFAGRVDIGATEYFDNFGFRAKAGPDHAATVTALPGLITLDGSGSSDPNGAALSYYWTQVGGPAGSFVDANVVKPTFTVSALGTYTFQLIVNNGSSNSFADFVEVAVVNVPPTADAGDDQLYSELEGVASVTLDASRSFDPENMPLTYRWKQTRGWRVQLSDYHAVTPTFLHPWPGTYVFEFVLNDGIQDSRPDEVAVVIGPNHAPVANAGPGRYIVSGSVTLDGTGSYDPDGYGKLRYAWRQVSGPAVTITGTNTSVPLVDGFAPRNTIQRCVFELVVNDGKRVSLPSTVTVTVVPNYGVNMLALVNPPFDPDRPTIVAFGGGNCSVGGGLTFGGPWEDLANWITVGFYGGSHFQYGDMLMVFLSSVAPNYRQPIQTMGWSTGNEPAMGMAWHINGTYRDERYAVNRVALLDAVCSDLTFFVRQFHTNLVAGEQCWVDNYVSNDSYLFPASVIAGALNIVCSPPRGHLYPVERYSSSSLDYANGGMTAFGYLSVIGSGKNYQLNTAARKYYFTVDSSESLVFYNESQYPGKILAPVQLLGPTNGATLPPNGAALGCQPVENAVGYQLLLGSTPDRVMDYTVLLDTTNPPSHIIPSLPQQHAWWTVRAYDQFGSTIYADPWLIQLPPNHPPVADAGFEQVVYAGLDGKAAVLLNGITSTDPDGDALTYTWAWVMDGLAYQSQGAELAIDLPVGVHTVQMMVNDGRLNSEPHEVRITVVAPLVCPVKIVPSAVNLRGEGPNIIACIRLPESISQAEAQSRDPVVLYPGGIQATKRWIVGGRQASIFAVFEKRALAGHVRNGAVGLTVVGKLRSGQTFYGGDTVKVIGNEKKK